ncbi:aminoglycoside phosphotransferase (APT) family kinase protein [Actinoplanes octamycinicus]|uniref:Aminoglycoside phosphotransferase (APT) family kinase protein n=1 Tax=Actinoplanes octamycinicus TaxID=135948 RepID=A0A7W7H3P1_9ACTN|nr:aminoglycoside phosphotransferase family protein [Actinoplanes octamycinicus]MBB4743396.1 aminoglycoside phosphotransferase (APT) family kinase protein [Actinoplanes octamycinicus]GIE61912.1 aminoglycoside phosphotransferase [Actinoplanes octamycinicus]
MESITKNRQSFGVLRAMAERAYGPGEAPAGEDAVSELAHGWFNVAYRIRLRSGREVVLKIAPPPAVEVMTYERGAMATELAALELIRARTGVPVPEVHFADTSRELCDADYFFMEYIDADNLGMLRDVQTPAERTAFNEALGALNRELNGIRGDHFGPLTGPGDPTWRAAFLRMIGGVLDDGERRGVDLGHDYAKIREVIAGHADSLDEVTEPRFVEWDMWDNNVMVRDGRIVAIIDHERAFFGDPLIEAGFTGSEVPAYGDSSAFIRGYGHGPATAAERTRRRLYCLYLVLIMTIETAYRNFPGTENYDWARERLDETMALFDRP